MISKNLKMSVNRMAASIRLLLIVGGAFLCSSAFWGAIVVIVARRVFGTNNEYMLLGMFVVTSAICLYFCIKFFLRCGRKRG